MEFMTRPKRFVSVILILLVVAILSSNLSFAAPFKNGVNVSVAPEGQWTSPSPLQEVMAQNVRRVEAAHRVGFDFIAIDLPITPWLIGTAQQQATTLSQARALADAAFARKMRVIVALEAGSAPKTSAQQLVCVGQNSSGWSAAVDAALSLLPKDGANAGIEPLIEPPSCTSAQGGRDVWVQMQRTLYKRIRAAKPMLYFIYYGDHWGSTSGLMASDPTSYVNDPYVLYTFHTFDPFLFTSQGAEWMGDGFYRYVQGLTWPFDPNHAKTAQDASLAAIGLDKSLSPDQAAKFSTEIHAAFAQYAQVSLPQAGSIGGGGTTAALLAELDSVAVWSRKYGIPQSAIYVGQWGVEVPGENRPELDVWPSAPAYLRWMKAQFAERGWTQAVWELDRGPRAPTRGGFGIMATNPSDGTLQLTPAYREIFP